MPGTRGSQRTARGLGGRVPPASWVLVLGLALAGCERGGAPGPASPEAPDQEVRNFTLTETVDGALQWRLTARHAETFRDRELIVAHGVAIDFFDEAGGVYSHLTAREGRIHTRSNDMEAAGDVVIVTTSGTRVETPSLRYRNQAQRIVSDDRVTVRRGGDVLTGVGFESDPSLENFEFRREVRAQVRPSGGRIRVRERSGEGAR